MPHHVIVDGSNLATEGRTMPSLKQLKEAVASYRSDHPDDLITVVVDATFGHRIDPKEASAFEKAIETNEFVSPPAGAVGRGDGFVLGIAQKVNATVLSNDSYQEFHGEYPWLFDEGRLVGGKPVPHVGWVFVNRVPVRGPVSRRSVKEQKVVEKSPGRGRRTRPAVSKSHSADGPMPIPKAPPPGATLPPPPKTPEAPKGANDLLSFLSFVEHFPVGTAVTAVVDSYSSHGAYVSIGDVKGYVPLRLMGDPPPRSAREEMEIGETVTLVVSSFGAARRSIDLAVPSMAPPQPAPSEARARKAEAKKTVVTALVVPSEAAVPETKEATRAEAKKEPTGRKAASKRAAEPKKTAASKKAAATLKAEAPKKAAATKPADTKPAAKKTAAAAKTGQKKAAKSAPHAHTAAAGEAPPPAARAARTRATKRSGG
jgi:S1 RNA binding domain/Zc3h12a-like Ribonuclease NYN domain